MENAVSENEIRIPLNGTCLKGTLNVHPGAAGLVLFAHGSGSGRSSPRNVYVARELVRAGVGALLFDLLTEEEETEDIHTGNYRFDIPLLAARLVLATEWAQRARNTRSLPIGYFGASTGSAAALIAAARLRDQVQAVVSRGGRPDLALQDLYGVAAPTLLLVGGRDAEVIALNRKAYGELRCTKSLEIIPGASHLFEESGALEQVADLASGWFLEHLHQHAAAFSGGRA
jgi:putative phosphoribosyl transferase